jgi:hypothetical protein
LHSKSTVNQLATITLILITFSALALSFAAAATTSTEDSTDFLFSLIQNANASLTETYSRLEANATAIPQDSLAAYNQALLLADEAATQLQAGNIPEANSKAIQALQKFKEALRIVYAAFPETPTEAQITREKTATIQSAIDRSYTQLQQLENLTGFAAATGYNTTVLEEEIETAKALLANASRSLNQQGFEAASNSTAKAKTLIANLLSHVNTFAATLKIQRLEAYVNQTEARLAALRTQATTAQNAASLTALNSADDSLANAKEYLANQQINATLTALASSKASEDEAAGYLNPAPSTSSSPTPTPSPSPKATPSTTDKSPTKTPNATSTPNTAAVAR